MLLCEMAFPDPVRQLLPRTFVIWFQPGAGWPTEVEEEMKDRLLASTAALMLASAGMAQAQDNMQKLEDMQTTGTGSDAFQYVPQDDENAAQLRKNLEKIKLPDGF